MHTVRLLDKVSAQFILGAHISVYFYFLFVSVKEESWDMNIALGDLHKVTQFNWVAQMR